MDSSPRPKLRPKTKISYEDIERIERVVWGEAGHEGRDGRDAIRSVIFNRLMSDRFGDTLEEVLTPDQFEPVARFKGIDKIPVPEDDLIRGMEEFGDYIQLGEDATDGRTFFQNEKVTKRRGTKFDGPDPIVIGKHTFYRGYKDQEPVTDTAFSHNIEIDYGEPYEVAQYARGGFNRRRGRGRDEAAEGVDDKFESLRDLFKKRRESKRAEKVAIDIEAATQQPMSVEEKRTIEGAVESAGDAAKKGGVRNTLFTETDELINTPEELERRENAPDPKKPAMKTDVEPQTRKLPAMYEDNPSGDQTPNEEGIVEKPAMSLYHGGDVGTCGCGKEGPCDCGGMMAPSAIVGFDPVSGNPIPLGSSAENVRDDIPAALSTGEYVMPADVVRWHGLRHIMDMYTEAKMGLMAMASIGQIRGIGEEDYVEHGYSEVSGDDQGNKRDNDEVVDEESTDDDGIEYAEIEVIEEEYPLEEEDSEGVEAYPTEEGGLSTVGDEQVLLIFQTPK